MFGYDKESEAAAKKLDKYDLDGILRDCCQNKIRDPWGVERQIINKHPELSDCLEDLTGDEFMEYLTIRYKVHFEEIIHYKMWYGKG